MLNEKRCLNVQEIFYKYLQKENNNNLEAIVYK